MKRSPKGDERGDDEQIPVEPAGQLSQPGPQREHSGHALSDERRPASGPPASTCGAGRSSAPSQAQLVYKHSIVSVAPMRHPSSLMQVPPSEGVAREEGVPGAPPEAEGVPALAPVGVAVDAAPPPAPEPGPAA